jgi:hypothetical protein
MDFVAHGSDTCNARRPRHYPVVGDEPFTLSYMNYDTSRYDELLKSKIDLALFKVKERTSVDIDGFDIITSPLKHFRQRCRFAIESSSKFNDHHPDDTSSGPCNLCYVIWEGGGPNIKVNAFPIAASPIYCTMPMLLRYIEGVEELSEDLKAINFLSTMTGELIATMIYERPLTDEWLRCAQIMVERAMQFRDETKRNGPIKWYKICGRK